MPYSDDEVILTADERLLLTRIERSLIAEELVSEPVTPLERSDPGWGLDALALLLAALGGVALGLLPAAAGSVTATTFTVIGALATILGAVICGLAPLRKRVTVIRRRFASTMRMRWLRLREAVKLN